LEGRDAGGGIARGRKDRRHARGVDAEQDGAVLEKRRAVPALRAADDLPAPELELVGAGPREAERGHRAVLTPPLDDLDRRAELPQPARERAGDPAIAREQV